MFSRNAFARLPCVILAASGAMFIASCGSGEEAFGKRYPVCASCVETLNQRRRANGLPQFAVETGAYDVGATVVFPITKEQP